ncbi:hypothetical protein T01_8153 [Trichinella spiralis]|uniref:Uncharacterized protein n=1 Tax=Trichinella spiralis TaxID=6334 RepID=A0A0V1BXH4_TRISP|nr:hypothetical protein T01_8153 [Trichinella spiralis]
MQQRRIFPWTLSNATKKTEHMKESDRFISKEWECYVSRPPALTEKSYDQLVDVLRNYSSPQLSKVTLQYNFHSWKQSSNELISDLTCCLCRLLHALYYVENNMLREQFAYGHRGESLQMRLYPRNILTVLPIPKAWLNSSCLRCRKFVFVAEDIVTGIDVDYQIHDQKLGHFENIHQKMTQEIPIQKQ